MIRSIPIARARSLLGVLLLVAAPVVLATCASDEPGADKSAGQKSAGQKSAGHRDTGQEEDSPEASSPPSASEAPSPTPTASPTPSLPAAADGRDAEACADGTCEIRVTEISGTNPFVVPLPEQSGFRSLEVIKIDDRSVTMYMPLAGSKYSVDGCWSRLVGPSGNSSGFIIMQCQSGKATTLNNRVGLEVVGIAGKDAVLRISAAEKG